LEGRFDGPTNMSRDAELLDAASRGEIVARVYGWDGVWVSLGYAQRPEAVLVDPDQTPWVLRPTGGAAVLHGHDLTVGLALPMRRSVRGSYRYAASPIVAALNSAGVPAALAEDLKAENGDPRRIDCFAGSSANDIVDPATRQKVCGCALRRTREAVLVQASIPVGDPLVEPRATIREGVRVSPVALDREAFVSQLRVALQQLGTPGSE